MLKKKIRKWLEIKDVPPKLEYDKELKQTVTKLEAELDFWKRWFKARTPKKKCTKCKVEIDLWPFNKSVAYYVRGNRVAHQTCPDTNQLEKGTE